MTDDRDMAELLGEAPRRPDPGFRFDVLARAVEGARRQRVRQRALRIVAVFTLLGLVFPLLRAFGVGLAELQPVLLVAGVLALAYVLALLTIEGPRALLARSRAVWRAPFLRA